MRRRKTDGETVVDRLSGLWMGKPRAEYLARLCGMKRLETAGGDVERSGARQADQGKRAAAGRRRQRDNRIGEQLRLDRRRDARSSRAHGRLTQAPLRDQILLWNAEQVL